jgi:hypothetical protein
MGTVNPSLAPLFCDKSIADLWHKLENKDKFSQLHSKFWGNKIEDEAAEWRGSNPTVDDPSNDIGPYCHVLNLGIDISFTRLWVRNDYIRIYDFCSTLIAGHPTYLGRKAPSVVITGQPGIGVLLSPVAS